MPALMNGKRAVGSKLILLASLSMVSTAQALELTASAQLETEYTSNTLRVVDNEDSNISVQPGINVSGTHDGPGLQAGLGYGLERRFQSDDRNEERNVLTGVADLLWTPLPNRLTFLATHSSVESTQNAFDRGTQNDLETTQTFSAGPTLMFLLPANNRLSLRYTYNQQESSMDGFERTSDRYSADLTHTFSALTSITAEVSREESKYSDRLARELTATTQSLTYNYASDYTQFSITGGYSEYEREGAENVDGGIGSLNWSRQLGAATTIGFNLNRQITDQSSRLLRELNSFDDDEFILFVDANLAEVFVESSATVSGSYQIGRNLFDLSFAYYESDYEDSFDDTNDTTVTLSASRRVTRTIEADASIRYREQDSSASDPTAFNRTIGSGTYDQVSLNTGVSWRITPPLQVSASVSYDTRSNDYDLYTAMLRIRYVILGAND